ncbi:hypothetical protein DE146DRAFT_652461 [Phaeosphaeria sp. MPI-PUGE-AT-0046c]|nr:hypothetical protein DE146DRAFT_652461 [Phaeosphaeria sp. MPI-PUGE-AT-0046c]
MLLPSSQTWKTPSQPTQTPVPAPRFAATNPKLTADSLKLSRGAPKESLNDEPDSQPYRRSGSVSSASSMSIKDAFKHIRKPAQNDDIQSDPFTVPASQNLPGQVNKADMATFNAALLAFRSTVDFAKEKDHLLNHLTWRASHDAAGPLPCLHQATGCNPAKEKALRLVREDPSNLLTLNTSDGPSNEMLARSISACMAAEKFLHCAVLTQMPVPAGKVEGMYNLFCPKYSEAHVDKYAAGQRSLSILRPLGFRSNTFTARLSLPPRPMAFTTRAFKVPVYAGFRTTTLTTSAEECELELTVLGNGYVLLRMDLGLLLTGKKSERGDGTGEGVCMEFMGVKVKDAQGDEAVKWGVLEEEVKKNAAAHGADRKGGLRGKVGMGTSTGAEDTPTKKKRGRPSKAELERRMADKVKEAAARGGF